MSFLLSSLLLKWTVLLKFLGIRLASWAGAVALVRKGRKKNKRIYYMLGFMVWLTVWAATVILFVRESR